MPKTPHLINLRLTKQLALDVASQQRDGRFTRVSPTFLQDAESALRRFVTRAVLEHPSVGKTLRGIEVSG